MGKPSLSALLPLLDINPALSRDNNNNNAFHCLCNIYYAQLEGFLVIILGVMRIVRQSVDLVVWGSEESLVSSKFNIGSCDFYVCPLKSNNCVLCVSGSCAVKTL